MFETISLCTTVDENKEEGLICSGIRIKRREKIDYLIEIMFRNEYKELENIFSLWRD